MTFIWTTIAAADVRRVRQYIARDSPGNAAVVVARIRTAVEALEQFPYLGRPGRKPDVRELVVPRTPYIVQYRIEPDVIRILRVLHGAQRRPERPAVRCAPAPTCAAPEPVPALERGPE